LEDTLMGKVKAWREPERRASKRQKDFTDILRLLEAHPELRGLLPGELLTKINEAI
jgi:hypothetical protein